MHLAVVAFPFLFIGIFVLVACVLGIGMLIGGVAGIYNKDIETSLKNALVISGLTCFIIVVVAIFLLVG